MRETSCALEGTVKGLEVKERNGDLRIKSSLTRGWMQQLRELGCVLAVGVVEVDLKELFLKNMRGFENRELENTVTKTLLKHIQKEGVQTFADVI